MTVSSRTWIIRLALRKAVADKQGIKNDEPEIINIPDLRGQLRRVEAAQVRSRAPEQRDLVGRLDSDQLEKLFN
ncbi:hypothetical protein [Aeromicrobium sp. UC242_57]|uniref:hypothetical protein n=1 Tax=Aeromicrobium sp. UC242_57 TaxID=3374624 RepID=UPI0037B86A23